MSSLCKVYISNFSYPNIWLVLFPEQCALHFFTIPLSHSFINPGTSFIFSPFFSHSRIIYIIFFQSPCSFSHPLLLVKVVQLFIISKIYCSANYSFWGTREYMFHAMFPSVVYTYHVPSSVLDIGCMLHPSMHLPSFPSLSSVPIIFINMRHLHHLATSGSSYISKTVCPGIFFLKFANYWSKFSTESLDNLLFP